MTLSGHVALIGNKSKAFRVLMGKSWRKETSWNA